MDKTKNYDFLRAPEEAIGNHRRFYNQALKKGVEVKVSSLAESYRKMSPSLHRKVNQPQVIDVAALTYSLDRLPSCIWQVEKVTLVQNENDFVRAGFKIKFSEEVFSKRRRRRSLFDSSKRVLGFFITSSSDVDDLVNALIAYQIEWQKVGLLLKGREEKFADEEQFSWLGIGQEEWGRVKTALGDNWQEKILSVGRGSVDTNIQMISNHRLGCRQIAQEWWKQASSLFPVINLKAKPAYFVSSNLHSLINVISGFVRKKQVEIFGHIEENYSQLYQEWLKVKSGENQLRVNDFLYFLSKIYFQDNPEAFKEKIDFEANLGIQQIKSSGGLVCDVQLIPVSAISQSSSLDPNLKINNHRKIFRSEGLIINIEYPLGDAAYFILSEILENLSQLKGVYIIGKAAILSGSVGDLQIPAVIFDERSDKIFFIKNIFNEEFVFKAFQSKILKEQKAVSVRGTFLENQKQLERYSKASFNIVEMESGPYLTALSEAQSVKPLSRGGVFHLDHLPWELGIINYASDNPFLEKSLGEGSLALEGIEPTYLASLAVLQRIIEKEEAR